MSIDLQVPGPLLDEQRRAALQREFDVLHLIYLRSKNQFHSSTWWFSLLALHKAVRNLLLLTKAYETHLLKIHGKLEKFQKLKKKRQYVETYTNKVLLKFQGRFKCQMAYFAKTIVPRAWRLFHGILSMGQFITLGFALIASLGKLFSLLQLEPQYLQCELTPDNDSTQLLTSEVLEDLGQEIAIDGTSKFAVEQRLSSSSTLLSKLLKKSITKENIKSSGLQIGKTLETKETVVSTSQLKPSLSTQNLVTVKTSETTKIKSKKRKKTNASFFDDLFGDNTLTKKKKKT